MANMNMEDPAKQEAIRRGHHEYIPTAGKHGSYVPRPYKHQEYPKMMGKWPRPEFKEFKGKPNAQELYQVALQEWDAAMTASTVNNKAEETAWLREHS